MVSLWDLVKGFNHEDPVQPSLEALGHVTRKLLVANTGGHALTKKSVGIVNQHGLHCLLPVNGKLISADLNPCRGSTVMVNASRCLSECPIL